MSELCPSCEEYTMPSEWTADRDRLAALEATLTQIRDIAAADRANYDAAARIFSLAYVALKGEP